MNKPTDEDYLALYQAAEVKCVMMPTFKDEATSIAKDLIAHGWREAIEALTGWRRTKGKNFETLPPEPPVEPHQRDGLEAALAILDTIAKERGYL